MPRLMSSCFKKKKKPSQTDASGPQLHSEDSVGLICFKVQLRSRVPCLQFELTLSTYSTETFGDLGPHATKQTGPDKSSIF